MAVEPTVLEGAFATILGHGARADVVQFHRASADERAGHFDAAIVTAGLAGNLDADVVVTLPDTQGGGGVARVTVGGVSHAVAVRTNDEVIDLLAEQFPVEIPDLAHRSIGAVPSGG